jgi:hypothetical protein
MKLLQRTKIPSLNQSISAVSILCLALISFSVNFPMFRAWFGIIDDHIIVEQLRPLRHITLFNLPERLFSDTEIGDFGNFPRYRPFYYLLKFALISLFGDWAGGYYLFRAFVQTFCSVLVFRFFFPSSKSNTDKTNIQQFFTAAVALLISVCASLSIAWTDITLRLGPSEIELTAGVLMTAYALLHLAKKGNEIRTSTKKYFLFLCAGVFIAVGAKENGLITILPFSLISLMQFRPLIQKSKLAAFAFITTICQSLFVLLNTFIVIARGRDIYDNPRSIDIMLDSLAERLFSPGFSILLISTGVLLLITLQAQAQRLEVLFVVVFLDLIYLSEGVFYAGSPPALRYQILSQFCILIGPFLALTESMRYLTDYFKHTITVTLASFLMIFSGMYFFLQPRDSYAIFNESARSSLQSTLVWRNEYEILNSTIRNSPDAPITIGVFNSGYDYERTFSLIQFIRFAGFNNPIFLTTFNLAGDDSDKLMEELHSNSINGSKEWEVTSINFLPLEKVSICFFFGIDLMVVDSSSRSFIDQRCASSQVISS